MNTQTHNHTLSIIILSLLALLGLSYYQINQDTIFPTITTPVTMDQSDAIAQARIINHKDTLGLHAEKLMLSASYLTDSQTNNYLTFNDRTQKTLNQSLKNKKIQTSYWAVRLFVPQEIQENYFYFTPTGKPYGFEMLLAQEKNLPDISKEQAIALAQKKLINYPLEGINHKNYVLKNYAQEKLDQRINHEIIFEDTTQSLIEAKLQIKIIVSGDQITTLKPQIKLPENFLREFQNMQSFNGALGSYGSVFVFIGYGSLILYALFKGSRKKQINWRDNCLAGALLTIFSFLNNLNNLPLMWFSNYKTTQVPSVFLSEQVIVFISLAISNFVFFTIIFSAAEYLSRLYFPRHQQLWRWWERESASSPQTIYLVMIGYIIFGLSTGYVAIFYLTAQHLPQIWIPAGSLFEPNIIALYQPFLESFSQSLQAGTIEECLFRAVPIASALILGKHYKKPWLFLALILPVQAIVFGVAHASYPQQPFYIRTVEMFLPFLAYGLVYFYHGLIPCIIGHYLYDVYQFSGMIFNMNTQGIWVQKMACIFCLLLPAFIVLRGILLNPQGLKNPLPRKFLNETWKPSASRNILSEKNTTTETTISTKSFTLAAIFGLLSFGMLYQIWQTSPTLTQPLAISKTEAAIQAQNIAKAQNINLNDKWQQNQIAILTNDTSLRYLIDSLGDKEVEDLLKNPVLESQNGKLNLESFLPHYAWQIRFARFEGTQTEKSNELEVLVTRNKTTFNHHFSENEVMPSLDEQQAITMATQHLKQSFPQTTFSRVKTASTTTAEKRVDWQFTFEFQGSEKLKSIQPRVDIHIVGNNIASELHYLFVPEKWLIDQQTRMDETNVIQYVLLLGYSIIYLVILGFACQAFLQTSDRYVFKITALCIALLFLIDVVNSWPILTFNFATAIDYQNQIIITTTSQIIQLFFLAIPPALMMLFCTTRQDKLTQSQQLGKTLITGVCLGLGLLAIMAGINAHVQPNLNWFYGQIIELSTFVPAFLAFTYLPQLLGMVLTVTGLVLLLQKPLHSPVASYLCGLLPWTIILAVICTGSATLNQTLILKMYKLLVCLVYAAFTWPLVRRQPLMIVLMIITFDIGVNAMALSTPAYTSAWAFSFFTGIIKLVCGVGLSWYWYTLQQIENRKNA